MPKKKSQYGESKEVRQARRYLGVLTEDTNSKFDMVIEQFGGINHKLDEHTKILNEHTKILDSHTKILDSHTKILDSHTKTLDSHSKILDSHTKKLDSHTEMIGGMAQDIETIKNDITFLKSGFKKKVDYEEFLALGRRVSLLESKVRR